jgi:hypothetical protein
MNLILAVVILLGVTLLYTLFVRAKDIPPPDPVSPTRHLEERRAAIYENLRDLQFEYRVGKLSDEDYAQTKLVLQKELAGVVAEMSKLQPSKAGAQVTAAAAAPAAPSKPAPKPGFVCPHCGTQFETAMKFCGECGKEMQ